MMKKLIVITTPNLYPDEVPLITALFEAGMERLHLRKPEAGEDELRNIIEQIPQKYYPGIVLHDHFELATRYSLGGVHLNSRNSSVPNGFTGSVSRSCHSFAELKQWNQLDYLFLSPIFQSISKEGYGNGFPWTDLEEASRQGIITNKVLALGGINEEKIHALKDLNFGGAVVLGALWGKNPSISNKENIIRRFTQLISAINEL